MILLSGKEIDEEKWLALLTVNRHASPFQGPVFYRLFEKVPGSEAEAWAIEEDGVLLALAVVIKSGERGLSGLFSKRGIIYGGPLIMEGRHDALDMLLRKIAGVTRDGCIYLETRNFSDYGDLRTVFEANGWAYVPYMNYHIATTDREAMTRAISASRLRQIKKAGSSGIVIREASDLSEVRTFYSILKELYTKRIRKPLLPWEFFRETFECGFGRYLLVTCEERIAGGIFCPVLEGRAIYEFYICGLDQEYRNCYPSVMATWAAMDYANRNGIALFDLMGAGKPGEEYGVREFKSRFGGTAVEYGRYLKVKRRLMYGIGRAGLKIMQKIKMNAPAH